MTRRRKPYNTQEVSTTVGTSDFVLAGSVPGNRTFGAAVADGDSFSYYIKHETLDEWETGEGTYNQGANSVVRTTVRAGSNGLSLVAFSAGNKSVTLIDDNYLALMARVGSDSVASSFAPPDTEDTTTFAAGPFSSSLVSARTIMIGEQANTDNANDSIGIGYSVSTDGALSSVALGDSAQTRAVGSAVPARSTAIGPHAKAYLTGMNGFSAGRGESTTDLIRLTTQTIDATPKIMALDDGGAEDDSFLQPILDGRGKTIGLEVFIAVRNETDNDAMLSRFSLLGHWDGANFVQVGTTTNVSEIKGTSMAAASVSAAIANDRLEVTVTGIAAKTIRWAGTVLATTLWHGGL